METIDFAGHEDNLLIKFVCSELFLLVLVDESLILDDDESESFLKGHSGLLFLILLVSHSLEFAAHKYNLLFHLRVTLVTSQELGLELTNFIFVISSQEMILFSEFRDMLLPFFNLGRTLFIGLTDLVESRLQLFVGLIGDNLRWLGNLRVNSLLS